ncbi:hypothetical protein [Streptomyces griseorubiginosus]|uniref:hypothetical protein n=1 Tax=Streptomyces griseorubiginosus TaxID=67304 RepID=UPI0036E60D3C
MSLRAAAQRPGPLPAARHGRDDTGRTEPGGAAQLARDADDLAGRYPDGRVPTLARTQSNASCAGPAPCGRRPGLCPPLPDAPEASVQWSTVDASVQWSTVDASVQWSTVDDEYGSARTARPWKDHPRSPRTDLLTTTEVSRTGNEPPPWGGAGADRQGIRAAHLLPTGETP